MQHGERLVHMLAPGEVDLLSRGRVAAFGVAAERGTGKDSRDAFDG
jgi:hypothetical protein